MGDYTRGGGAGSYGRGGGYQPRDDGNRQSGGYGAAPTRGGHSYGDRSGEFRRDQAANSYGNEREAPTRGGQSGGYGAAPTRGGHTYGDRSGEFRRDQSANSYGNEREARGGQSGGYGAAPTRGGHSYGDRSGEFRRDQAANSYGNEREAPTRGGHTYGDRSGEFRRDQSANSYGNEREARGGQSGGYGAAPTRGGHSYGDRSGEFHRDQAANSYGNERGAPTRGGHSYGDRSGEFHRDQAANSYGNERGAPTRGGQSNGYEAAPTRGYSSGRGGGGGNYPRGGYRDQNDDTSSRGYGASARGGGRSSYDYDRQPSNDDYRRDQRSNGYDDRSGYGGGPRGSFSGGRGGGRYEDRRNDENGYKGLGGYSGFGQFEDGRKEYTEENHAPRDYKPIERNVDEIFAEDKEDALKNTATIFDADADVIVEEAKEILNCENWDELQLDERLMDNITGSDYVRPRKIQQRTIPYILDGYDVKCQGETGSGKTAAFLIPIVQKLIEQSHDGQLPRSNPVCLIVAPTRELVSQIYEQAKKFTNKTNITVCRAYGEYAVRSNLADIRAGCNILVACIGRLMHFVRNGEIGLRDLKFLVLDEADRLLMENSNSDILQLFQWPEMPKGEDRQTLLFSATLRDPVVMELTREYLRNKSVLITVTCQSNKRVQYKVFAVPSNPAKFKYLNKYIKKITEENGGTTPRTLIFVNRKINTDRVAIDLTSNKFPSTTIHGDRGQHLREEALASFRSGKTRCLVATDVCARGIDIKDLDFIINYDLPSQKDDFVQRCGRTGRVKNGVAMSFYLEDEDRGISGTIAEVIQQNDQQAPSFLNGSVSASDYNFGEGEVAEEAASPYGNNTNEQYGSNDENRSRSNSAVPPPGFESGPPPRSSQNTPPPIVDNNADEGWD